MSTQDIIDGWNAGIEPYELDEMRYTVFQAASGGNWPDAQEQERYWKAL